MSCGVLVENVPCFLPHFSSHKHFTFAAYPRPISIHYILSHLRQTSIVLPYLPRLQLWPPGPCNTHLFEHIASHNARQGRPGDFRCHTRRKLHDNDPFHFSTWPSIAVDWPELEPEVLLDLIRSLLWTLCVPTPLAGSRGP